jgi:hypothetical protein
MAYPSGHSKTGSKDLHPTLTKPGHTFMIFWSEALLYLRMKTTNTSKATNKSIFSKKVPIQTVPMQGCGKNWDNDCGIMKKNG